MVCKTECEQRGWRAGRVQLRARVGSLRHLPVLRLGCPAQHTPRSTHLQELVKVDGAGAVLVDVRNHLLDLLLLGLKAQRAHRHLELLQGER